ncbi:hypothetical protein Z948_3432 [Sulfitobacter donghicola DSW-25 = KCTC 12864 = JCM 14565]|nr:hypothetical protein Z948_3432 [Sulfitobacter donghicola DSW-25 = KCTC 12864 = JCM 14565]
MSLNVCPSFADIFYILGVSIARSPDKVQSYCVKCGPCRGEFYKDLSRWLVRLWLRAEN